LDETYWQLLFFHDVELLVLGEDWELLLFQRDVKLLVLGEDWELFQHGVELLVLDEDQELLFQHGLLVLGDDWKLLEPSLLSCSTEGCKQEDQKLDKYIFSRFHNSVQHIFGEGLDILEKAS